MIILVVMFICFFALSTNMSANLYEQSKEVGVMRSIGLTKNRIKLLYFYEAFVLVFVSCLMGVLIGVSIGYTMKLQQQILIQMSLTFVFPGVQIGVIFLASILCAFLATWGPTTLLTSKQIAVIFRL